MSDFEPHESWPAPDANSQWNGAQPTQGQTDTAAGTTPAPGEATPAQPAPAAPTFTQTADITQPTAPQGSAPQGSAPQGSASQGSAFANPFATGPAGGSNSTFGTAPGGAFTSAGTSAMGKPTNPKGPTTGAKRRGPGWIALIAAMAVTAALSIGGTWALTGSSSHSTPTPSSVSASTTAQTVTPVQTDGTSADWQAVAAAVSPAVVTINFQSSSEAGVGSGVIYDASGHVVTNYHVISGALGGDAQLTVTLADGRMFNASVVGYDQTTDLAVIQITDPPQDLTVANFGSSDNLQVGQEVMAVGSPLGLSNTVTTGIISALDRPVEVSTSQQNQQSDPNDPFGQLPQFGRQQNTNSDSVITNAIQVDASINPGNSGGPLFDATGAVIGINSSIASMSTGSSEAGSIGLGFAIPVDLVKTVVGQLIDTGSVDHALLGVQITTATTTVDGTTRAGAEVASVNAGGAAQHAGIKEGDVIIAVDGHSVESSKSLSGYIRRYTAGSEVTVTYVRDGQAYDATVTLTSMGH